MGPKWFLVLIAWRAVTPSTAKFRLKGDILAFPRVFTFRLGQEPFVRGVFGQ